MSGRNCSKTAAFCSAERELARNCAEVSGIAKSKNIRATKAFRDLKDSLKDSLEARGLVEPVYTELLSRYLDLWCEYQHLTDDINERGVVVMDEKRGMLVENRSLTIRHQTSNKMLDIYAALGFRDISAPRAGAKPSAPIDDDEL